QLSAVFSNLLGNAVEATNGQGRVRIKTREEDRDVVISIEDNGRGLEPEMLKTIFDPGFQVARGRVASGNWSMFSSRQIVQEHGGDIQIASKLGEGTCISVRLPAESEFNRLT
ncbi:MAG TPA: ATP-binding protein, partial [Bryobacteraceae bacterium]|nr:ATP-binding protein [Bryobacteraceae bacterium]